MVKKVAIVGPESTGKSTLCKQLAEHFDTEWVPEFAREYLESINRPYNYTDLKVIAKGQLEEEDRKEGMVNDLLICDTTMLVMKVWSEHKYDKCDPFILEELKNRKYDLHLLTDIDLPWIPDPLREHPDKRKYFIELYEQELSEMGVDYVKISGNKKERLKRAIKAVKQQLSQ